MVEIKAELMAELLGVCIHDWIWRSDRAEIKCSKCDKIVFVIPIEFYPFTGSRLSYDTIDMIVEQMPEVWKEYCANQVDWGRGMWQIWESISRYDTFLKYLYDTRDAKNGWAYSECIAHDDSGYPIMEEISHISCSRCNGTYKILNQKYAEARELLIKEMEGE